jgi:hypothetical protein
MGQRYGYKQKLKRKKRYNKRVKERNKALALKGKS